MVHCATLHGKRNDVFGLFIRFIFSLSLDFTNVFDRFTLCFILDVFDKKIFSLFFRHLGNLFQLRNHVFVCGVHLGFLFVN